MRLQTGSPHTPLGRSEENVAYFLKRPSIRLKWGTRVPMRLNGQGCSPPGLPPKRCIIDLGSAAKEEDGRLCHLGVLDGRDRVGDPGPRRDRRDPDVASEACSGVGREDRMSMT